MVAPIVLAAAPDCFLHSPPVTYMTVGFNVVIGGKRFEPRLFSFGSSNPPIDAVRRGQPLSDGHPSKTSFVEWASWSDDFDGADAVARAFNFVTANQWQFGDVTRSENVEYANLNIVMADPGKYRLRLRREPVQMFANLGMEVDILLMPKDGSAPKVLNPSGPTEPKEGYTITIGGKEFAPNPALLEARPSPDVVVRKGQDFQGTPSKHSFVQWSYWPDEADYSEGWGFIDVVNDTLFMVSLDQAQYGPVAHEPGIEFADLNIFVTTRDSVTISAAEFRMLAQLGFAVTIHHQY